jgi:hypothetical protein
MLAQVIEDMVESGSFNGINFCLACMVNSLSAHRFHQPNSASKADDRRHAQVRRPLRSKHSFATDRCVAKFDQ